MVRGPHILEHKGSGEYSLKTPEGEFTIQAEHRLDHTAECTLWTPEDADGADGQFFDSFHDAVSAVLGSKHGEQ